MVSDCSVSILYINYVHCEVPCTHASLSYQPEAFLTPMTNLSGEEVYRVYGYTENNAIKFKADFKT